jgi:hypothetical protein
MKEERKCNYRNCSKDITKMRPNAKYCSRNCKGCEAKYDKREDNKIIKEQQHISKMLKQVLEVDADTLALFALLNKK